MMKATAQLLPAASVACEKSWFTVFSDLFKARLTLLVLLTTAVGFYLGNAGKMSFLPLANAILGTALLASGAAALNQLFEREYDARMVRTQERPLPSGRLQPSCVAWVGWGAAGAGVLYLAVAVNLLTALLGAASLLSYLFIYTPLKRVTWLNTLVGAAAGGLPVLMGWTAGRGDLSAGGYTLFGILALWQLPHFMAIAWLYREDYARAGFKMLPVIDPDGHRTARQAVAHACALLPVSMLPFVLHVTGTVCLAMAVALGLGFIWTAVRFARQLTPARARHLFYASLLYLPLLLTVMVLDKTPIASN